MQIAGVGGGPAALYFAILMKRAFPAAAIVLHERNRPGDTFGWGVVFSDETLDHFREADPESHDAIRESFVNWTDIETHHAGACVRSSGHGFSGLARKRLLEILHGRCRALGVTLRFESEIEDPRALRDADLVLGADGVNSLVRKTYAGHFRPEVDWGRCRFSWLGTDKPLQAFTFVFRENEHGWFQVHAYPFARGLGTWIVECREETWRRAGLDASDEAQTLAYCQRLFAQELDGHRLLGNHSIWRRFPTVRNATWHHENVVLLGDAAHTAHFSIGSGTKLAMEDAIALVAAFRELGLDDVPRVLAAYEERRRGPVARLQETARTSLEWFENASRYRGQHPVAFTFNLLTRSSRISYDKLRLRDPDLVRSADERFAQSPAQTPLPAEPSARTPWPAESSPATPSPVEDAAQPPGRHEGLSPRERDAPPPMFVPLRLRGVTLANRVVVSPMCQYAARDGAPGEWHLVHLGSRAVGGAGLVLAEMTCVEPRGRITRSCAGIWDDAHVPPWRRIVDFVHEYTGARIGLQLGHAGRKGSCSLPWEGDAPLRRESGWPTIAPSALPYAPGWPAPAAMDPEDMRRLAAAFRAAARRADHAGFDVLEIHMAHGYLLSSFLSPLSNRRDDAWGGDLEGRMRFPLEVLDGVREVWPREKPIAVRISATDWLDERGGFTVQDGVEVSRALRDHGCDLVDVSSGGVVPDSRPPSGRMVQVPLAERIRWEAGVPVCAVGGIRGAGDANTVLGAGRADLCALARPHLLHPYLTLEASAAYGRWEQSWPPRYLAARPRA